MKLAIAVLSLGLMAGTVLASNNASDNASNSPYQPGNSWNAGDNGGTGFGVWSFAASGAGGHFIGATGETDNPSFGLFGGGTGATDLSSADRPFTGGAFLSGQTFSLDLGNTANISAGDVGLNFLAGTTVEFTLKFASGQSFWQLNDGGSDFNTTIPFAANTKIHFAFTYNGGSGYSILMTEGSTTYTANNTASNTISGLTGVRFFSNQQGGGENFGFNNLAIVPEPSVTALLAGSSILGASFYLRRRRKA